jgi:hypothetical protein
MSYSGFPTGFSLESVIGNIDPYVSSLDPKGAMGVGDFAPMDEGSLVDPIPLLMIRKEAGALRLFEVSEILPRK